ncbi:MAG: lytic transglycosylase domain-containing protein [Dysgonamonadaceae bacterium]|jgi:hypothetical protein|nr:lytic transglycosylase domain-containing protein [Dysgonamonadaceae bacterium]
MKYLSYLITTAGLLVIVIAALLLQSNADLPEPHETAPASTTNLPERKVPTETVSVPFADEMVFCGEKISLDRYDMHERFDRELNSFTYFHSTTMLYIKRANRYFPIIEPILQQNGIPDDFKYLATIESNLDIRAYSPAKAAGLWQFLAEVGRKYGLEVTDQVDERYHIEKATQAACNYLKDAYARYGDWATVAVSYNAGMGRVNSQLDNQQVNSAFDLLLVEESSRYLFRILAIKAIFSNPRNYGFVLKPENLYIPIRTKKTEVASDIPDLATFAKKHGINYAVLKDFNVWLRDSKLKVTPGKKYKIDIPEKDDLYYSTNHAKVHDGNWVGEEIL